MFYEKTTTYHPFTFLWLLAILLLPPATQASNHRLEFQKAAAFTHLQWPNIASSPISIKLNPLINYSGIPMEERQEKAEYYYHGKLPMAMNRIVRDAFRSTHLFNPDISEADYEVALIINRYQLPFKFAPDDIWWQKLHDETDRFLQSPPPSLVELSIKLSSGKKPIKSWISTVEIILSNCDLNATPQPSTVHLNQDPTVSSYLSTTPGQSFLAATNYLLLRLMERLQQEPLLGQIDKIVEQEIYLHSEQANFIQGNRLNVFYNHPQTGKASLPSGQIKVVKAMQNRAIAYPVSLRTDHLKPGDWIEIFGQQVFTHPKSQFTPANHCAEVDIAMNE
ncbi:hypothetical protein [Aliikangiella maris]|uniref:Uncharacterized protein n=2 Tax=Aliikangiella maris TaxID=3162458 RepID=A0ABV2BS91_9GAMM